METSLVQRGLPPENGRLVVLELGSLDLGEPEMRLLDLEGLLTRRFVLTQLTD